MAFRHQQQAHTFATHVLLSIQGLHPFKACYVRLRTYGQWFCRVQFEAKFERQFCTHYHSNTAAVCTILSPLPSGKPLKSLGRHPRICIRPLVCPWAIPTLIWQKGIAGPTHAGPHAPQAHVMCQLGTSLHYWQGWELHEPSLSFLSSVLPASQPFHHFSFGENLGTRSASSCSTTPVQLPPFPMPCTYAEGVGMNPTSSIRYLSLSNFYWRNRRYSIPHPSQCLFPCGIAVQRNLLSRLTSLLRIYWVSSALALVWRLAQSLRYVHWLLRFLLMFCSASEQYLFFAETKDCCQSFCQMLHQFITFLYNPGWRINL